MSCEGVGLTYLGAKVTCPACKRIGVIVADGPRWPGELMGHQAALEGDKVACGCSPLPTMIASQSAMFECPPRRAKVSALRIAKSPL
ncbi:TPA: PAAR domain-containing protein [Burkholderia vietnamiensis]|nr:PAAR domain-containing protein [Burkholderia vietnamiensis]